ncbi:hypothetical protein ONS96_001607 [Cadophora gregata f. sp. sojae]|nr:hypothetical protein ONS96_001607 [Cadophora gregata f. sp. sojae]
MLSVSPINSTVSNKSNQLSLLVLFIRSILKKKEDAGGRSIRAREEISTTHVVQCGTNELGRSQTVLLPEVKPVCSQKSKLWTSEGERHDVRKRRDGADRGSVHRWGSKRGKDPEAVHWRGE